jgi:hypothetical protein
MDDDNVDSDDLDHQSFEVEDATGWTQLQTGLLNDTFSSQIKN